MSVADTGIRDVVVQLTGSPEDEARLQVSLEVASTFDAHLICVHLNILPDILQITDPLHSATIRSLLEESERKADESYRLLVDRFDSLSVAHEFRRLHGGVETLGPDLAAIVRTADLFIGTRPYGDPTGHSQIEERILFGSACACLFLPPGGSPHTHFNTITVAWDGSREAARAVAEAMPFLVRAKTVHLVAVAPVLDEIDSARHFEGVTSHLRRHGIDARATVLPYISGTGEQIERFAHQQGSDLIVAGAYGHARVVEWIFGGVTRYLLRHATLPLLMAH